MISTIIHSNKQTQQNKVTGLSANILSNNISQGLSDKNNIVELFLSIANNHPTRTSVICCEERVTYGDLKNFCLYLAEFLQYFDLERDQCIGIYLEPSIDLMISIWGILATGCGYLPLSPEYPEERLKFIIKDSGIKLIITNESIKNKIEEIVPSDVRVITLMDCFKNKEPKSIHPIRFNPKIKSNSLAYIIYTSGSTGKPKGVMIEHHSILNQMNWLKNAFNLNKQDIILQKTPMSFDAAQWELLALCCGCTVVMGSSGLYKNPQEIINTINKYKISVLQCVPTLLQALIDNNEFKECKSLTQIFSGGEALSKQLALECVKTLPQSKLVNLYGPTECTINASSFTVDPNSIHSYNNTISIGLPIDNTHYYILDNNLKPVKIREMGELYISGVGVARGYLNRPELTEEKFLNNPFYLLDGSKKIYKTGDLASWNADGTVHYSGRIDNQVKLRGYRIELDEIKSIIDSHNWIKHSAVIIKNDAHTGYQNLIAFVELNPKEAALMDQGNHDSHHQSKESKLQVIMQLSNMGCRDMTTVADDNKVNLPAKIPSIQQQKKVYARKTYRYFEGGIVTKADILRLLKNKSNINKSIEIKQLGFFEFGEILRYFGQFSNESRLLPKYGYASPGALYATQMYLEINGLDFIKPGYYYYHPLYHQLVMINVLDSTHDPMIKVHFIGKKSAIEPVYKNNIQEVLELETGHMIGLFENILPDYGLNITDCAYEPNTKKLLLVDEADYYLGTFNIVPGNHICMDESIDIYVQSHPGKIADLKSGLYQYHQEKLIIVTDEIILKKHVIAINQEVYDRSSFGIALISNTSRNWLSFINLGRKLQRLQMNDANIGLMSSGYSSKSGNDLPSATRIKKLLNSDAGQSYFFIGGRISNEQICNRGMKEDTTHMMGPAEMLKNDLKNFLPDHMIPNKVVVLDQMPLTVNGKINLKILSDIRINENNNYVIPRNDCEKIIHSIWSKVLKKENISIYDNFFEIGGNSLLALRLINDINTTLAASLSVQIIFESSTIEKLAQKINCQNYTAENRLVLLQNQGLHKPIYCWPGLGGYCMNLRVLANKLGASRPFYGIQTFGINENEIPFINIEEMAAADISQIKKMQPTGPYTLWGYSFGAKVAFEAAYQLEKSGDKVESLLLIAPGMPKINGQSISKNKYAPIYQDKGYLTILFSVFMGGINDDSLHECLAVVNDEETFINFILKRKPFLTSGLVKNIMNIVSKSYAINYTLDETNFKNINTTVSIIRAAGDDNSFIEQMDEISGMRTIVQEITADHYNILKEPYIDELIEIINAETLKYSI